MSMVTFTAMADGVVSVTYLNADSTKIMIDLSAEVAVAKLQSDITLTKGGSPVSFTLVKKPASKETTHGMTANTNYSYVIKPEGGVEFDVIYNLNIAGTDCNKLFTVEELWKDDFQTYSGDTGATTSWRNGTLYVDGADKYLQVSGMAGKGVYPYYDAHNFSTYGMTATKFFDAARLATTDYSVEAKVKFDESNATNINRTLQISMQTDRSESVGKWGKPGFCGGAQYYKNAAGTSEYNKMFLNAYQKYASNDGRQGIGTMQDNMKDCDGVTVDEQTLDADWTALSMSVKGNNAKVFAGEDAFANYNHTIDLSTGYGAVVFVTRSSGTFYIDDVIATKMTELTFGNLEIPYWNADSTKIMLDLSAEVDADALKNAITLTKDETTSVTDFTVVKKPASKETTRGMTANTNYSYVIKPAGGITFGSIYEISIAAGLSATDLSAMLPQTYTKAFKVEELWKDDFQTYEGDTGATTSWRNGTLYVDGADKYLQVSGMAGKGVYPYYDSYNFSTYGMTATKFFDAARLATTDYNVELKTKFEDTTYQTLQISMQADRSESVGKWGKGGIYGGALRSTSNKWMFLQANQAYNKTGYGIGDVTDNAHQCGGMTVDEQPLESSDWNNLSMSVKGNNVKVFGGENAFANYDHTIDFSSGYGAVVFVSRTSGTYYIDDVIASKATEVAVGPKFGTSLNVVNAEEGKVNVSWEYDGKGNNLPCKVILACYGENNSLKNAIPWDGTNLSGNGTITFENFELKGGTELKLFVWKDLATLYPYCATVQWPQANQ